MNKRTVRLIITLAVLAGVAGGVWLWAHRHRTRQELALYGNVDVRQVDLPFNDSDRVAEVLVQEGDRVARGQVLARLDTSRLGPQLAQAEAMADAQQQVVGKLHAGSRPQEIAQARANLAQAEAEAADAEAKARKLQTLWDSSRGRAMSQQDLEDATTGAQAARARATAQEKAVELAVLGPRREDIAQAEAQLRADRAQVALLQRQFADASLVAPVNGVIRSRIVEPGEIVSPQKTAFTVAITDPKWVRAYVSEPDLGLVRQGEAATVTVDAFPHQAFQGWVGFISPVAEFTPKAVQTEDLRSSLVYEIRVFVRDPGDRLRLGSPATVHLPLHAGDRR